MGKDEDVTSNRVSRRNFNALLVGAGMALGSGAAGAAAEVVEKDVTVKTPDGHCDAAYFHPAKGKHPGVLIWTDVFALRPAFRAMGKRLAAEGYSVLVPNVYYRTGKAPFVPDASHFDFHDKKMRAQIEKWTAPIKAPGAIERDAAAHIAFLDARKEVDTAKKIGTQGYCMGGPLAFKTCATAPSRVGAGATFHGGGLVTDKPDSPHLLAPKMKSRMYIAIAASDDAKQPDAKDKLREAFAAAHVTAAVEVYPGTIHGWCVPDMPMENGKPIYNKAAAERAWAKLLTLYKETLA